MNTPRNVFTLKEQKCWAIFCTRNRFQWISVGKTTARWRFSSTVSSRKIFHYKQDQSRVKKKSNRVASNGDPWLSRVCISRVFFVLFLNPFQFVIPGQPEGEKGSSALITDRTIYGWQRKRWGGLRSPSTKKKKSERDDREWKKNERKKKIEERRGPNQWHLVGKRVGIRAILISRWGRDFPFWKRVSKFRRWKRCRGFISRWRVGGVGGKHTPTHTHRDTRENKDPSYRNKWLLTSADEMRSSRVQHAASSDRRPDETTTPSSCWPRELWSTNWAIRDAIDIGLWITD